jgi:hypothetical protein
MRSSKKTRSTSKEKSAKPTHNMYKKTGLIGRWSGASTSSLYGKPEKPPVVAFKPR